MGQQSHNVELITYISRFLSLIFAPSSHSRDHTLSIWERSEESLLTQDAQSRSTPPVVLHTLKVNALNYCRFSLLDFGLAGQPEVKALLAVPNAEESTLVSPLFCNLQQSKSLRDRYMVCSCK
jgi:hypothetical protein